MMPALSLQSPSMADWITVAEAVSLSGYSAQYIRRLARTGKIESQHFGHVWQFDRTSLLAYVREARNSSDKRRGSRKARSVDN
jgi:hypothetical protein